MTHRRTILFVLLGAWVLVPSAAAQVRVYAKVEIPGELYPGDRFNYSIVVENGGQPTKIDTSPLSRFDPSGPSQQQSTRIVNFQTSSSVSVSYTLTAPPPGPVRIGPVTLEVNGTKYTTNPVEFTVVQSGTTDKLKLTCTLSQPSCYVGQPILMSVTWTILVQNIEDPSFQVPIFQSKDFYFEDPEGSSQTQGQSFAIHNVPVVVFQESRNVKGVNMTTLSFDKILIPKHPGKLSFNPANVSARIPVGRVRTNDFFSPYRYEYKRFSVSSQPLALEVKPLPSAGRPADYYGLVGSYTIATEATPTKVNVGDPITLTLRIGGNPFLKPVQWPDLEKVPALAQNFRLPTEKASPTVENGAKVFTQTLRAKHDRVTEIPAIPLAIFDPETGTYKTVTSDPIPLTVAPSKVLNSDDLEGFARQPVNREVEAIKEGLAANYTADDALRNQAFSLGARVLSPGPLLLWALPLLSLLASVTYKIARHTTPAQIAAKRRRQAVGHALRDLRTLSNLTPAERPERLAQILRRFVGDRFDRTAGALTALECHQIVTSAGIRDDDASRLREIVSACEAARYAPQSTDLNEETLTRAAELVRTIDKATKTL